MQTERLQDGSGGTTKTRVFKNFIDGEWVESVSGNTFEDRNPADTREVVAIFQCSNKAAVDAAKRAFADWWLVPAPRRAEMVFRAADLVMIRFVAGISGKARWRSTLPDESRQDASPPSDLLALPPRYLALLASGRSLFL